MQTTIKNKLLGIDFGTKTIGIAISDSNNKFAVPYCEIPNNSKSLKEIHEIVKDEKIGRIILGFPKMNNDYVSERHELIKEFKNNLEIELKNEIEIILEDESYSTKSAYDSLSIFNLKGKKKRENKDMVAASIILENYLNKMR